MTIPLPPKAVRPDYAGGGIVNLMASLLRAQGADSTLPEADCLPASRLGRRQVLLLLDGLGAEHLASAVPDGFLHKHLVGRLTSVYPSATAAAIPSFLSAEPPLRHGFTGWYTWLRELAMTVTVLPYISRAGFVYDENTGKSPRQLARLLPFADRIRAPMVQVQPRSIAFSAFSRDFAGRARTIPYKSLNDMIKRIRRAVSGLTDRGVVYAYWPDYDHLAHAHGVMSDATVAHMHLLDEAVANLAADLAGQSVDLIVCSDHGFGNCPPEQQFLFTDAFPALAVMTRQSLTGEPRAPFAYLRQGAVHDFMQAAESELAGIATSVTADALLQAGLLGTGEAHPWIRDRIGDVALLMHAHHVIFDPLPGDSAPNMIGHHGGLSRDEMSVPVVHCRC